MQIEIRMGMSLYPGSCNAVVAPVHVMVSAINSNADLQRFLFLYIGGNYTRVLSGIPRDSTNFEIRHAFTAHQPLSVLREASHTIVLVEHDPTLFEGAEKMLAPVARALKDTGRESLVILYAPAIDRTFAALMRQADRIIEIAAAEVLSPRVFLRAIRLQRTGRPVRSKRRTRNTAGNLRTWQRSTPARRSLPATTRWRRRLSLFWLRSSNARSISMLRGMAMWIIDSAYRNGGIDLWTNEDGAVTRVHHPYDPLFFVHFADPHASHEMIGTLEERYGAEECTIRTVFDSLLGYRVFADRRVAEAIEGQAQYDVQLFNVDVHRDQRFMAEYEFFPCSGNGTDRFSQEGSHDLDSITIRIHGEPERSAALPEIELVHERTERFAGPEGTVLSDLFSRVSSLDPDVILMPDADAWMPRLRRLAQRHGLVMPFSRNGKYRSMDSRSYWSYGKMEHKDAALVPGGRVLIDTERSFVYREGGLEGVLMSARLSGLSPNLASRFTPGTLISSYETYEAVRRGIAVPFRKSDSETIRRISTLQSADRGGMMFQPRPGVFENVEEIDFTSMYPSIIVQGNLSPETIGYPEQPGFLPAVLNPLLDLRIRTKQLKKTDPAFDGIDSILKWMLVTCFGYTGYKNAKFGRIEVHKGITKQSWEILIKTKDISEKMGFTVLHGIVDCLWVQGSGIGLLKARVEQEIGLPLEVEHFDWIVFDPLADGFGAHNRYFGRHPDGSVKVRGIAARAVTTRRSSPAPCSGRC
ncbi:type B DNA-directed DNA polymerase [Methanoregula formicica]|uniref:DNA-directed DNA polymerase n=1 Tax=Methanoregula formicica (strain DSM 22288 / NBRC 105244 / SMSP) TaxID=593750 RepID=L0HHL3_METFS|nr:type B DNA-directed DNA polymerase [Methanoregula formicica]AGB03251.1 DNA polymerase elongation subunit (family B) [Methanoregula formicica SMSP]